MTWLRWILFVTLAAFGVGARLLGAAEVDDPAGSALIALGILIVGGALAGDLAVRLRLPRISGYLVLGILVGPYVGHAVTLADHRLLRLFEELALGLIALTAGGELRVEGLRSRLRSLLAITAGHTVGVFLLVSAVVWTVLELAPQAAGVLPGQRAAAAILLGAIAVASSPATAIAIITETRSRGPLVNAVLGVTIVKDLIILLMFTWAAVIATTLVQGGDVGLGLLRGVGVEIFLSLAAGVLLGVVFGAYLVAVGRYLELTVVLLALVSAELGHQAGLKHLLVCMAAGFVVRNLFSLRAGGFIVALEQASPPVYVVFFALVGAGLDVRVLAVIGVPALLYVLLRLGATWMMTAGPARLAGASPHVIRSAWMGFVAQAGLSLGFASRIRRELPEIGVTLAAVVVASVVLNQLAGPVLWERALRVAGEARDR